MYGCRWLLNLEFILKLELINYVKAPQIITAQSSEKNMNQSVMILPVSWNPNHCLSKA